MAWEPVQVHPNGGSISTPLKAALAEAFYHGDSTDMYDDELTERHLTWLRGYAAGSHDDEARTIVAAIEKYGAVRIVRS